MRDPASVHRRVGLAVNLLIRALILAFAVEAALASPGDPRFEGKGIAVRNVVFAGAGLTLVFPLLHARHPRERYPIWTDALFLSILALDMAFNSLNLYETGWRLDLVPHTYGPAAGLATLRAIGVTNLPGLLAVNGVHVLLEIQEAIGDAVFGTHNVHGWWDTVSDLGAGLVGSAGAALAWGRVRHRFGASRRDEAHRSYSAA